MIFEVQHPTTGKIIEIEADKMPDAQQLQMLFKSPQLNGASDQSQQPPQQNALQSILQTGKNVGNAVAPISNFLMSNVVKGVQQNLQQVGAGNLTPTKPNLQSILASSAGPVGETFFGTDQQKTQQAGNREMYATLKGAQGVAGVTNYVLSGGANTIKNIVGAKSINPWKVTGYARNQAIQNAPEIKTDLLTKAAEKYIKNDPRAAEIWDQFKPTITNKMPAQELLDKMNVYKQAYTAGGKIGRSEIAGLFNALYKAGKTAFQNQAPEVAKQTSNFKLMYDLPKAAQKATWLGLKATAIGKMLGL